MDFCILYVGYVCILFISLDKIFPSMLCCCLDFCYIKICCCFFPPSLDIIIFLLNYVEEASIIQSTLWTWLHIFVSLKDGKKLSMQRYLAALCLHKNLKCRGLILCPSIFYDTPDLISLFSYPYGNLDWEIADVPPKIAYFF